MRIEQRLRQREADRKLRDLEKQQQAAKEKTEEDKIVKKKNAEDYETDNFIIRAAETDEEKRIRLETKKQKFYADFKPDFDVDEVPPLE